MALKTMITLAAVVGLVTVLTNKTRQSKQPSAGAGTGRSRSPDRAGDAHPDVEAMLDDDLGQTDDQGAYKPSNTMSPVLSGTGV